jgi:hypothetical protein
LELDTDPLKEAFEQKKKNVGWFHYHKAAPKLA